MTHQEKLQEVLKQNGGILTTKQCKEIGIPTMYLTRMVHDGKLIRVKPGIYVTPTGDYDELYFLHLQSKVVVFSYVSSLYLHGLTDVIPEIIEVSVYKGYNAHRFKEDVRIHYVNKDIYELGIVTCLTDYGNTVYAYDMERTICDLILNQDKIDLETLVSSIHRYCKDPNKDLKKLYQYAEKMKIQDQVFRIIELSLGA